MPLKSFTSSLRSYQASGLATGMRIGRQREDAARPVQRSMLEEAYNLAKSTFNRKEVFPSEVERVSELLCKPKTLTPFTYSIKCVPDLLLLDNMGVDAPA